MEDEKEETKELTAEQVVQKELKKFNLADAEIAKLSEKYMALKIKNLEDKEGIKAVSEARKHIKQKRVDVEKVRKREKEFYLKTGKAIDEEAKRLTALLTPMETYLEKEETRIEDEEKEANKSQAEKVLAVLTQRSERLSAIGGAMDFERMRTLTDEEFETEFKEIEADILLNPPTATSSKITLNTTTTDSSVNLGPFDTDNVYDKIKGDNTPGTVHWGMKMKGSALQLKKPLIFFDVESTGLNWESDEPIQIAIFTLFPDGSSESWSSFIKPMRGSIPEEITALTGITYDMVKDFPTFKEMAGSILGILTTGDLAGYNIMGFDVPFMSQKFSDCGFLFPLFTQSFVDVANIYKKMNPRTLADAYRHYVGAEMENAHNAEYDNKATFIVLENQIEKHAELGKDVESISKFCMDGFQFVDPARKLSRDKDGDLTYNIGKYKGEKVKNQPGFADWMIGQPWITQYTIALLRKELNPEPEEKTPFEKAIETSLETTSEDDLPI